MSCLLFSLNICIWFEFAFYTCLCFKIYISLFELSRLYICWVWPPHSNSNHQDYYMFNRESRINLHLPLLLWGGHIQMICSLNIPRSFTLAVASQLEALGTATFQDGGGTGQVGLAGGAETGNVWNTHDEKMPCFCGDVYVLHTMYLCIDVEIYTHWNTCIYIYLHCAGVTGSKIRPAPINR